MTKIWNDTLSAPIIAYYTSRANITFRDTICTLKRNFLAHLVRECSHLIFLNVYLAYKTRRRFKNSILRFMVVKILEVLLFIRN